MNVLMNGFAAALVFGLSLTVASAAVPELLKMADGRSVTSREMWERERRPELLKVFTERVFGVRPEERPRYLDFADKHGFRSAGSGTPHLP